MTCDHQAKVVRKTKDKEAQQSFTVVGDGGLVERRNRDEVAESDLLQRQQLALAIMQAQDPPIKADPVDRGKRRCKTCYKYLDFMFVVDGQPLPHCQLNKAAPGETVRQFCPILDPPSFALLRISGA